MLPRIGNSEIIASDFYSMNLCDVLKYYGVLSCPKLSQGQQQVQQHQEWVVSGLTSSPGCLAAIILTCLSALSSEIQILVITL
jgi:hypothetical protein